jgi:hypothetical protein
MLEALAAVTAVNSEGGLEFAQLLFIEALGRFILLHGNRFFAGHDFDRDDLSAKRRWTPPPARV